MALPTASMRIARYASDSAMSVLLDKLGYTNVKAFGGIIDWPYETTTEE